MKGEGERVLYLSETVDSNSISASYSNGLLTIRMSKQPAQKRYRIPITEE
ncbi:MAG: Hsp20/alpha crystallin family protein [Desulfobacterales bacterium]